MATVLITGSNRGIGLQLCRQLHARGDEVIAACRKPSKSLREMNIEIIDGLDVAQQQDVDRLATMVGIRRIDTLINNAGILRLDSFPDIDEQQVIEQFRVNTLGPLKLTRALMSCLGTGSKVAIVSSRVGSIADNASGNNYGYRLSKVAANMLGANLAIDLKSDGIAVILLHPGLVATEMTGGAGISADDAAKGLIRQIDALTLQSSGKFMHAEGYELPW